MAGSPNKRRRNNRKARIQERIANLPMVIAQPEPEEEPKDRWGRPTKFRPEYAEQARVLCEEGATDKELADHFGINKSTIYEWQRGHPEFLEAMKLGKGVANDRLERTAFELAVGYSITVRKSVKLRDQYGNEKLVETEEEVPVPPNGDILKWMLKNRKPEIWKDRSEQHVSGAVLHVPLTIEEARNELAMRLQQLRERRNQ